MKEYVCKNDLFTENIKVFPTVTKYDICKEFADKLKKELNPQTGNFGMGFNYEKMCERIDDLLAEMEEE